MNTLKITSPYEKWLPGVWTNRNDNVEYEVSRGSQGEWTVTGIDLRDGEILIISDVGFDGKSIRFVSVVPSIGYAVRHVLTAHDPMTIEHTFEITENWFRKGSQSGCR